MMISAGGARLCGTRLISSACAGLSPWLVAALMVLASPPVRAQCPPGESLAKHLAQLPLEQASRTTAFSVPAPRPLYAKAIQKVGSVETRREGNKGLAVAVVALPIEVLWRAINDEAHHAQGDYLLVQRSEVIGGTPRGERRRVFQAGSKMGIGRFWVTDTRMSGDRAHCSNSVRFCQMPLCSPRW